jgi:hypothetical protein
VCTDCLTVSHFESLTMFLCFVFSFHICYGFLTSGLIIHKLKVHLSLWTPQFSPIGTSFLTTVVLHVVILQERNQ